MNRVDLLGRIVSDITTFGNGDNTGINFTLVTSVRIPIEAGQGFRREAGHHSGLKPATVPTRSRPPGRGD